MTPQRCTNTPLLIILGLGILLLVLTGERPARADTATLTEDKVSRLLAAYPDVRALAVKHGAATGSKVADADNPLAALASIDADGALRAEVDAAVRAHGFRDVEEWLAVSHSVVAAYMHLKKDSADRKIAKAIAKIENNDLLPDKYKRKLIKAIRESAGATEAAPPKANVAVVRAMMADIDAVVKRRGK